MKWQNNGIFLMWPNIPRVQTKTIFLNTSYLENPKTAMLGMCSIASLLAMCSWLYIVLSGRHFKRLSVEFGSSNKQNTEIRNTTCSNQCCCNFYVLVEYLPNKWRARRIPDAVRRSVASHAIDRPIVYSHKTKTTVWLNRLQSIYCRDSSIFSEHPGTWPPRVPVRRLMTFTTDITDASVTLSGEKELFSPRATHCNVL